YSEYLRDGRAIPKRSEHAERPEGKWPGGLTVEGARQIRGELLGLSHCELRGRRAGPIIESVRNDRAIADRPDIPRAFHPHIGVGNEAAMLKRQAQFLNQRVGRRPDG